MTTIDLPSKHSATGKIPHPWVWVARAVWVLIGLTATAILIIGILKLHGTIQTPCSEREPEDQPVCLEISNGLSELGLSPEFYATYLAVGVAFETLLWVALGTIIFVRRSDDRLSLVFSLVLVLTGVSVDNAIAGWAEYAYPPLAFPVDIILFLGSTSITMGFVFPDGRFVPRWTRWVAAIWVVRSFVVFFVPETPLSIYPYDGVLLAALFACVLYSIGYRYWRVADPHQRQQIKWVLASTAIFLPVYSVGLFVIFPETGMGIMARMIYIAFRYAGSFLVPLGFTFSILRYRLWDVDFVINRTLVLGIMALLFIVLAAGSLFAISQLAADLPGGPLVGVAIGAAIFGVAFGPVYRECRIFVDRLYGIKLDYVEAVKAYGGTKREARKTGDTKETFGAYTGLTLLGRGGMGEVYRAQHPTLKRAVAIKILPDHSASNDEAYKRFMREAQTIAGLKHPNVITLHDVGEQEGRPFMVMEYIDGQDLADLIKTRGRLLLAEALPILSDVAAALDHAHQSGVIHRDVKPSNVMIEKVTQTGMGKTTRAVLMDFGIAKGYHAGTRLTHSGMIGTLDYISPEQIQGAAEVDARADIYSFGVMAYETLTGELPFKHNNPGAMVLAHLNQPAPDPRQRVPDLPEGAAQAVMRAMSKKPEQRFASAGEFVAAIR